MESSKNKCRCARSITPWLGVDLLAIALKLGWDYIIELWLRSGLHYCFGAASSAASWNQIQLTAPWLLHGAYGMQ